jgi:hypothetical protein
MVKFRNGVVQLTPKDFVYCPICGVQTKDKKKFRIKCSLEGVRILFPAGDFLVTPVAADFNDPGIKVPEVREKAAFDGHGVQLIFLCEEGHYFTKTIANHGNDEAISFAEEIKEEDDDDPEMDNLAEGEEEDL